MMVFFLCQTRQRDETLTAVRSIVSVGISLCGHIVNEMRTSPFPFKNNGVAYVKALYDYL